MPFLDSNVDLFKIIEDIAENARNDGNLYAEATARVEPNGSIVASSQLYDTVSSSLKPIYDDDVESDTHMHPYIMCGFSLSGCVIINEDRQDYTDNSIADDLYGGF